MTKKEDDIDVSKPPDTDFVAEAVAAPVSNEPPIPVGHARFYCNKCHTVRARVDAGMAVHDQLLLTASCQPPLEQLAHNSTFFPFVSYWLCLGSRTIFPTKPPRGDAPIAWNSIPLQKVNVNGALLFRKPFRKEPAESSIYILEMNL